MKKNKFLTFQEKVQPLSKDETGQLRGGFTDVDMATPALLGKANSGACSNGNCPSTMKNGSDCKNTNCSACNCCNVVGPGFTNYLSCSGGGTHGWETTLNPCF